MRYPYYDICFTVSGYSGTQDFDNTYLGPDRFYELKPTVKLEAIFSTDDECAAFLSWWAAEVERGKKIFVATCMLFGRRVNYGFKQLTPLINSIATNGDQKITFQAKVEFNPDTVDNTPPVAEDKEIFIWKNVRDNVITLEASDVDYDPLTYEVEVAPSRGELRGTPPLFMYTPDTDFLGIDCFSYVAKDYWSRSKPAVVTINVTEETIPDFIVSYNVSSKIRVSGNFFFDRGDGIGWKRGFGGYIIPFAGVIKIASYDHKVDERDDVISKAEIIAWGTRTDFSDFFKNKTVLTEFSILIATGTCQGIDFTSMFENTRLTSIPMFDMTNGLIYTRMFAKSYIVDWESNQLQNGTHFNEMWRDSHTINKILTMNTTKGKYFQNIFTGCTALECVGYIDTRVGVNKSNMFPGGDVLLNPTSAEQTDLMDDNGAEHDNHVGCGLEFTGITYVSGSETCEIATFNGICTSSGVYKTNLNSAVGTVIYAWTASVGVISAGQGTDSITVTLEAGEATDIVISCVMTDDVGPVNSGWYAFDHLRTYGYEIIYLSAENVQINLETVLNNNGIAPSSQVAIINNVHNCSIVTGNLGAWTLGVYFVNNSIIEGFPKERVSGNDTTNSGFTSTSTINFYNNGEIRGAGGYGGKGGRGADTGSEEDIQEEMYDGVQNNRYVWFAHCNDGNTRVFWDYNQGGEDYLCCEEAYAETGPYYVANTEGSITRGAYKQEIPGGRAYAVVRNYYKNTTVTGGEGGLGGRGIGFYQSAEDGVGGGTSNPAGGNYGGRGGYGGTWGSTGNVGGDGGGSSSSGEPGYAGAPALVGVSFLVAGHRIGKTLGEVV